MNDRPETMEKFKRQEALYDFPYHYIPHFDDRGVPSRQRFLRWGLEYLCYMKHIADIIADKAPSSLLDVGCGDGRLFSLLEYDVPRRVGADLAERSIRFARAFNPGVEFIVGDVGDLSEEFEMVTAVEVLEHIPDGDVPKFVRRLAARLKPGGELIVSVPSSISSVEAKHYRHYSAEALVDTVTDAADDVDVVDVEHIYEEPKWLEVWKRLTCNRLWELEISVVRRFMWNVIWNSLRQSNSGKGRHLIGRFSKN